MTDKQIIVRRVLENILLERIDDDRFEILQDLVRGAVFSGGYPEDEFLSFFDLCQFGEILDEVDFPFLQWWDKYCADREREMVENSQESAEILDDYYRAVGAK